MRFLIPDIFHLILKFKDDALAAVPRGKMFQRIAYLHCFRVLEKKMFTHFTLSRESVSKAREWKKERNRKTPMLEVHR